MSLGRRSLDPGSRSSAEVEAFLRRSAEVGPSRPDAATRGRLIFALDATMSRQPTWDLAIGLQARMFDTAASIGGLDVQLVYFRGLNECRASPFVSAGSGLARYMSRITVQGGNTQIGRVLKHVRDEVRAQRVGALIYVGDAVEERVDPLCAIAGELGLLGLKAFMFHEGRDTKAERTFREIARLTGGAYAAFDGAAPERLAALLRAAAAYAAGGLAALEAQGRSGDRDAQGLLAQLR